MPPATSQTQVILSSIVFDSEKLLGHISPDDDEIDDHLNDSFSPWLDHFSSTDPLSLIHISGDEDLQNHIRMLCNEFRDIFSDTLSDSAADIPPFELIVDDNMWASPKNRTPPRPQSTALVLQKNTFLSSSIPTLAGSNSTNVQTPPPNQLHLHYSHILVGMDAHNRFDRTKVLISSMLSLRFFLS